MVSNFAELFGLGTPELIVIFLIVLLLFGSKKLPELARSAGSSVRELKKGLSDGTQEKNSKEKDGTPRSGPAA